MSCADEEQDAASGLCRLFDGICFAFLPACRALAASFAAITISLGRWFDQQE
jgi:hypothetical protein